MQWGTTQQAVGQQPQRLASGMGARNVEEHPPQGAGRSGVAPQKQQDTQHVPQHTAAVAAAGE